MEHVEDIEEYTIPKSMLSKSNSKKSTSIYKDEISIEKYSPRSIRDGHMSINSHQVPMSPNRQKRNFKQGESEEKSESARNIFQKVLKSAGPRDHRKSHYTVLQDSSRVDHDDSSHNHPHNQLRNRRSGRANTKAICNNPSLKLNQLLSPKSRAAAMEESSGAVSTQSTNLKRIGSNIFSQNNRK